MEQSTYYILVSLSSLIAIFVSILSYINAKKAREESKYALELKYKPSLEINYVLGSYDKALSEFSPRLTLYNTGETSLTIDSIKILGDIKLTCGELGKYESPDKAENNIVLGAGESKVIEHPINISGADVSGIRLLLDLSAKNNSDRNLVIKNKLLHDERFVPRDFL